MPSHRLGWSCSCSTQELRRGNLALVWTELMRNGSSKPKLLPWWCTAEAHRGDNHYKAGVQFFDYSPSLPTSWEREEQEGEEDDQEARGLACLPEASAWAKGTAAQQARAAMNTQCIPKKGLRSILYFQKANEISLLCWVSMWNFRADFDWKFFPHSPQGDSTGFVSPSFGWASFKCWFICKKSNEGQPCQKSNFECFENPPQASCSWRPCIPGKGMSC